MDITIKDLFCGCGGSSQGAKNVPGVHVKYAMNHWRLAVDSHNTNHPDTYHDCADISDTHPARYDRTTILIGSPECKTHSPGQGKRRKNLNQGDFFQQHMIDPSVVRSRATMWDMVRFAEVHKYENVITENVVEVRKWPLFDPWLKAMHTLGYRHKCVYLNSQFAHGDGITGFAPQSRDRIYIVFWKKGNPEPDLNIRPKAPCLRCGEVEAVQSWKDSEKRAGKYRKQYIYRCSQCGAEVVPYYYAAANCIDFSIPMVRIGDREKFGLKPLKETTVARIKYGLEKYGIVPTVLDQRNQSGTVGARIRSVSDPLNTQHTGFSSYLFAPYMLNLSHTQVKGDRSYGLGGTFPTQTTQESLALLSPDFGEQFAQAMTVTFRAGSVVKAGDQNGFRPYAANCLTEPLPTQVGMAGFKVRRNAAERSVGMISVNSLSGGKTSSYMAVHYPADIDIFALVCVGDRASRFLDVGIRRQVQDRLDKFSPGWPDFTGTGENVLVLKAMLDLEQMIGREIVWVRGIEFGELVQSKKMMPNRTHRFCTTEMKIRPIFSYLYRVGALPCEMRIGFRFDEAERSERFTTTFKASFVDEMSKQVDFHGRPIWRHRWQEVEWRTGKFPLIDDRIMHPTVQRFWRDKSIIFPDDSNCQFCFWKSAQQHRKNYAESPDNAGTIMYAAIQEYLIDSQMKEEISLLNSTKIPIQLDFNFGGGPGCSADGFCTD